MGMNRREFLTTAGTVAVTTALVGPPVWRGWWDSYGKEHTEARTEAVRARIKERYGTDVLVEFPEGRVRTLDDPEFNARMVAIQSSWVQYKVLTHLERLLMKYPPSLLRGSLKTVYIVSLQSNADGTEEGLLKGRAGIGEYKGTLSISIVDILVTYFAVIDRALDEFITDHELAHVFDEDIFRAGWAEIQPGVVYGQESYIGMEEFPQGFVDLYGLSSPGEDIAQVSALLFETGGRLRGRHARDPILARKVDFLKNWYEIRSGGLMDAQYWTDVEEGRITEAYWDEREAAAGLRSNPQ